MNREKLKKLAAEWTNDNMELINTWEEGDLLEGPHGVSLADILADFVLSVSGWTAVEDGLPEDYQDIWVTYNDGTVDDATQQQNIVVGAPESEVIAWMLKIPPPPYEPQEAKV